MTIYGCGVRVLWRKAEGQSNYFEGQEKECQAEVPCWLRISLGNLVALGHQLAMGTSLHWITKKIFSWLCVIQKKKTFVLLAYNGVDGVCCVRGFTQAGLFQVNGYVWGDTCKWQTKKAVCIVKNIKDF